MTDPDPQPLASSPCAAPPGHWGEEAEPPPADQPGRTLPAASRPRGLPLHDRDGPPVTPSRAGEADTAASGGASQGGE